MLRLIIVIFHLRVVIANGLNSSDDINTTSSRDRFEGEFGCKPPDKWTTVKWRNAIVEGVCISEHYNVNNQPKEISGHPIVMSIGYNKIMDIDEKRKTITTEIHLTYFWVDERINAVFSDNSGIIALPPIITDEKPIIWNPFDRLEIMNLKKREWAFILCLNELV